MPSKPVRGKKSRSKFDQVMMVVALGAPVMTVPQVFRVWVAREVSGISVVTWVAYTAVAVCWVVYGIKHREKPIILTNSLLLLVDAGIVVGVLVHR